MTRRILGFCGLIGAGKTVAAQHLVTAHGFARVRFAGPLKDMCRALGLSEREVDGDLKEQPSALLGGKTPRWAMQSLGTEWGRNLIAEDLWIRAWRAACDRVPKSAKGIVADDVRFENEADAIRALAGRVIRIHRGAREAGEHASENQKLIIGKRILNNGSIADLHRAIDELVAG